MHHTPLHLQLLLHYHCSTEPFPRSRAPAVIDFTKELLGHGLLAEESEIESYRTTERGKAFIGMLLSTPLPVMSWVHPRTGEKIT